MARKKTAKIEREIAFADLHPEPFKPIVRTGSQKAFLKEWAIATADKYITRDGRSIKEVA